MITPEQLADAQRNHRAFYRLLKERDACDSGLKFARYKTLLRAWAECEDGNFMSWWIIHNAPDFREPHVLRAVRRIIDALYIQDTPKKRRAHASALRAVFTSTGVRRC